MKFGFELAGTRTGTGGAGGRPVELDAVDAVVPVSVFGDDLLDRFFEPPAVAFFAIF